jgi:hypothetical protein
MTPLNVPSLLLDPRPEKERKKSWVRRHIVDPVKKIVRQALQ